MPRAARPGPLPLPKRHAAPCPAGGQSPRPAPAPPPAGASRPPGRALASAVPGPAGLQETVVRRRGNALRFGVPAKGAVLCIPGCPVSLAGAIAFAIAPHCPLARRAATKAPGPTPAGSGADLRRTCMTGSFGTLLPDRAQKRSPFRGPLGTTPPFPDQDDFPVRQAAGLLFQHPVAGHTVRRFGRIAGHHAKTPDATICALTARQMIGVKPALRKEEPAGPSALAVSGKGCRTACRRSRSPPSPLQAKSTGCVRKVVSEVGHKSRT